MLGNIELGTPSCIKPDGKSTETMFRGERYNEEILYAGFYRKNIGKWSILTQINANEGEHKKVVFKFHKI